VGLFGLEVLANGPLGFPGLEGRVLEDRELKLGLIVRPSVLENEPPDFRRLDSRKSVRGIELDPDGFLPYFANALGFANFEGRSVEDRGENSGRLGFEDFANEPFDLPGAEWRAPDEPRLKLALVPLASVLRNEPEGFADIDGRESGRGANFGAGLLPCFENELLAFENVRA
jgi:hypothetical protein